MAAPGGGRNSMKERGRSGSDSSPDDAYTSDKWEEVSAEGSSSCDDADIDGDDDGDSYTDFDEALERTSLSSSSSPLSSPSSSSSSSLPPGAAAATAVVADCAGDASRRRELLASIHQDNNDKTRRQGSDEAHNLPVPEQHSNPTRTQPVVVVLGPGPAVALSANLIPPHPAQKTKSPTPLPEQGHAQQLLDESAVAPPPPPPGGVDGAQQNELSGEDCELDNNNNKNNNNKNYYGRATQGGAADVATAPLAVPLSCGASCCSAVDPFEGRNDLVVPSEPSPRAEESESEEDGDYAEFALLESCLAQRGVPPAFSPRRAPRPQLRIAPLRCTSICWSDNNQRARVEISTPLAGGHGGGGSGQMGRAENYQTAGVEFSTLPVTGKVGHQTGTSATTETAIKLQNQPISAADSNNSSSSSSSSSSVVGRRPARRGRNDDHPPVAAAAVAAAQATSTVAARRPSPKLADERKNCGGASLVDRIRQHGLPTSFHAFPGDGGQISTTTTTTTARRRAKELISSGGEVAAAGPAPETPPLEGPPAARGGVRGGATTDSANNGPWEKTTNSFVRYSSWTEYRGPSFSDELRAVASGIRRQTRHGSSSRASVTINAERDWDDICQERHSQGGGRYRKARLNRSKRFVRRSLIGRIGALAAMESLKYPPRYSPHDRAAVGGGSLLGDKECTLSALSLSRQPTTTATTVDYLDSEGGGGGGATGAVVKQEGGIMAIGVVGFGGSPVVTRQTVRLAVAGHHPDHDGCGIFESDDERSTPRPGPPAPPPYESGSSMQPQDIRDDKSHEGDRSSIICSNSSGSSRSRCGKSSDRVLDGEAIRTFARRCLAESRTL